ncbi:MAG: HigA family addiction module antitoxin [Treponema sp.]|nr:HigA family addiction module antitoxin [Treponema sp.]
MKQSNQTPGTALKALLKKHGLNCNRLAKAINMSNAMVRLMVLDESPISVAAAFRLAKFFKNQPEYWLNLQLRYDMDKAAKDKALAKELKDISDVSKYSFVRKPHAKTAAKKGKKKASASKTASKTALKTGKKKTSKKKPTLADKRKAAAKKPGAKPARGKKK